MKKMALFCVILLMTLTFTALAEEVKPPPESEGPGYTIKKDTIGLRVDEKGCMTQIEDELIELHNKKGIERFGQLIRIYNSDWQEMEVVTARVIQKDGRTIQVSSTAIKDIEFPTLMKSSLYKNIRVKTVDFPDLLEGSTIAYRIETSFTRPYPGEAFWETSFTEDYGDILRTAFFVEVPDGREVNYITPGHGRLIKPKVSRSAQTKGLLWNFRNMKYIRQQIAMPPLQDIASRIMVSSFHSWDEVAQFFSGLFNPRARMDEAMNTRLDKVVGGTTGKEKVSRIFRWLCKEKEVVEINLGVGGYDFNEAPAIYKEKHVSSRDFALLLYTMLRKAEVEVYPVLVSSFNMGKIYDDFPSIQQFDTILLLVKVDGETIWIEPLDNEGGIGELSSDMQGRPAFIIRDTSGELSATPLSSFQVNREEVKGEVRLTTDGSIDGVMRMREYGAHKVQWLRIYNSIQKSDQKNLAKILLGHIDPRSLLIDYSFKENLYEAAPFSFRTRFKINNFAKKTGNEWMMNVPLFSSSGMKDLLKIDAVSRIWPIAVGTPFQEDRHVHMVLPEGWRIKRLPKDRYVKNDVGALQVVCNSRGTDVSYYTRLVIKKGMIPEGETALLLEILQELNDSGKDAIMLEERK